MMRQQKMVGRMQVDPDEAEMYVLADEMLREMRKNNPQWEARRQEAERVSQYYSICSFFI